MRRGFGIPQIAFIIILAIVVFKVVIPKLSGAKNDALIMASFSELDRAVQDIGTYHFKKGEFGMISSMTNVLSFDDVNVLLREGTKVKFAAARAKNAAPNYCMELTLVNNNGAYKFNVGMTDDISDLCMDFRSSEKFKKMLDNGINLEVK